jgi:long-subunit acyl-CoA synthetase (AMP-forming)
MFLHIACHRREKLADKISKGDKVLISAGRGSAFFIDMFVVWSLGGVVVPYAADAEDSHIQRLTTISEAEICLDDLFLDTIPTQDQSGTDEMPQTKRQMS